MFSIRKGRNDSCREEFFARSRKTMYSTGLLGGILKYAAQTNLKIDFGVAKKNPFRMKAN